MYNQNVVIFISDLMKKSTNEISRITNLYVNDMSSDINNIKKRLITSLKNNFSSFLGDQFHILEEIVEDNFNNNLDTYTDKLHKVEQQISNYYKKIEIELQGGLATSSNIEKFKILMNTSFASVKSDITNIEKQNNKEAIHDANQFLIGMQNKLHLCFDSIGLTSESVCGGIIHTIDIYQNNLLDQISDKIPTLAFLGISNIDWISNAIIDKMNNSITKDIVNLDSKEMSMSK